MRDAVWRAACGAAEAQCVEGGNRYAQLAAGVESVLSGGISQVAAADLRRTQSLVEAALEGVPHLLLAQGRRLLVPPLLRLVTCFVQRCPAVGFNAALAPLSTLLLVATGSEASALARASPVRAALASSAQRASESHTTRSYECD